MPKPYHVTYLWKELGKAILTHFFLSNLELNCKSYGHSKNPKIALIRGFLGSLLGLLGIREYSIWTNERGATVTVLFGFFFRREAIT